MNLEFKYNIKGTGPKVETWGEKPFLIYMFNVVNNKKLEANSKSLPPYHFYINQRQWFTNWEIEVYEWVGGNLQLIAQDKFIPSNKITHFYLESNDLDETIEYTKACLEYVKHWEISQYLIETYFPEEINNHFNISHATNKIDFPEACYVNYVIKKQPSLADMEKFWGVGLINEEIIYNNFIHPYSYNNQSSYELAKSILFGPDYETIPKFIPYDWSLKERIVY